MTLHFKIIVGTWKLEDWHIYRYRHHVDAKTGGRNARWWQWDKVL